MIFQEFLDAYIPRIQIKHRQVNQMTWILETTGSKDAAKLKAEFAAELNFLCSDKQIFDQLKAWNNNSIIKISELKRQLNVLIRMFEPCQVSLELQKQILEEESSLSHLYSNFRPKVGEKTLSENDIRSILKKEKNIEVRKKVWNASKQIGSLLAPDIIKLVNLRNTVAKKLGYSNYFSMQLKLQEVDEEWLFEILDYLENSTESAYFNILDAINDKLSTRFSVTKTELGPWAWADPFCQEDPLDVEALDELVKGLDILELATKFYQMLPIEIEKILKNSDNFERSAKNQHAFCLHIDRQGDIRTLNNIKPTFKWLEIVLHELGHAIYEQGYSSTLPWLLRSPPHMITTEAVALLTGRQIFRPKSLKKLIPEAKTDLIQLAEESLKRRQLIFCRWVLLMTHFERELYLNPNQNLNRLWWNLVKRFQYIQYQGSPYQCDWAAKYHIGLAPVYYYSYLLGELFASTIENQIPEFFSSMTSKYLNDRIFCLGNSLPWDQLIEFASGKRLTAQPWLSEFAANAVNRP